MGVFEITDRLRQQFLEGVPKRVELLELALKSLNWVQVRELAHQLKGTAGCFGVTELQVLASNLEVAASREESPSCFEELKKLSACKLPQIGLIKVIV